jgi:hypothetical protein
LKASIDEIGKKINSMRRNITDKIVFNNVKLLQKMDQFGHQRIKYENKEFKHLAMEKVSNLIVKRT